jgi:hypothetical protein
MGLLLPAGGTGAALSASWCPLSLLGENQGEEGMIERQDFPYLTLSRRPWENRFLAHPTHVRKGCTHAAAT